MLEKISDYPILQAGDDGFLMQLRDQVIEPLLELLGISECGSISECIAKLREDSEYATDKGASLPFYEPLCDDEGVMRGYNIGVVWAGAHVGIPLYGDIASSRVESLIKGTRRIPARLSEEFLTFSPAFQVALVVHHIIQNVAIDPMAAEAFVLGRYDELGFEDSHFAEYRVPSTELVRVSSTAGLRTEWVATSVHSYTGCHRAEERIGGWNVRVRGSRPKRETMLGAWNEIRNRFDEPHEVGYTVDGKILHRLSPRQSGIVRKRIGDPEVELMCSWVDRTLAEGSFPMKGKQKSWKEAVTMFGKTYPNLAARWTADSMRKSYQHHKSR